MVIHVNFSEGSLLQLLTFGYDESHGKLETPAASTRIVSY